MTEDKRRAMMEKIQKLFARAADVQANEHEAMVAGQMAAALLLKYNIEESELRPADLEGLTHAGIVEKAWATPGPMIHWQRRLVFSSAEYFFCRGLSMRGRKHGHMKIMGRPQDVDAYMLVLDNLRAQFQEAAKAGADEAHAAGEFFARGDKRRYKNAFLNGCAAGYIAKLAEEWRKPETAEQTNAIMPIMNKAIQGFIDETYKSIGSAPLRQRRGHGYDSGYRTGRSASGHQLLGSG